MTRIRLGLICLFTIASALVRARGARTRRRRRAGAISGATLDDVDAASQESFPASDPPPWTGVTGVRLAMSGTRPGVRVNR